MYHFNNNGSWFVDVLFATRSEIAYFVPWDCVNNSSNSCRFIGVAASFGVACVALPDSSKMYTILF